MFPKARVIIAEIEDDVLGVGYRGPVRRMLDAGAGTYLTSTTIPRLAKQLDHTVTQRHQITGGATARLEIEPSRGRQPPERTRCRRASCNLSGSASLQSWQVWLVWVVWRQVMVGCANARSGKPVSH
jgi:hypothetical protein